MEQFVWRDSYSVKNDELDSHHKQLIAIFNELYDCFQSSADSAVIGQVIEKLIRYADYHFNAEEQYMRDRAYLDLHAHKTEHLFFKEKISYLQYRNLMNDAEVSKELVIYLGNWLINHVIREDKKYSA